MPHAIAILKWYAEPARIPSDPEDKRNTDMIMVNTAMQMIDRINTFAPATQRDALLKSLTDANLFLISDIQFRRDMQAGRFRTIGQTSPATLPMTPNIQPSP